MDISKTVLITGASSGFGKATAELLASQGFNLILVARRNDRLQSLKKNLKTNVHTAILDVTDKKQVKEFFESLPKDFQDIDVLINNAGLALGMGPVQESNLDDWDMMVDTNIKGLLYMTRAALEIMVKRGTGQIVNIGSIAGHMPYKGGNVYGATKAFVRQFSRNLRTDLYGTGVRVSNVEPGAAETEFSVVRFKSKQAAADYYKGWQPLTGEDVAQTVAWTINQPEHVNVDNVEVWPLAQTYAGGAILKA